MSRDEELTEQLKGKVIESVESYPYGPTRITFSDGIVATFNASGQPPTVRPSISQASPPPLIAKVFSS